MATYSPARSRSEPPAADLEPFLFAEIGREDNGMILTVASAFARLGVDPWHQASTLARLSDTSAASSLAAMLGRLQGGAGLDVGQTAARLVRLLPHQASQSPDGRDPAPGAGRSGSVATWLFWAILGAAATYVFVY